MADLSFLVNNEIIKITDTWHVFYMNRLMELYQRRTERGSTPRVWYEGVMIEGVRGLDYAIFSDYLFLRNEGLKDIADMIVAGPAKYRLE